MAVDISLLNNVVQITDGTLQPQAYSSNPARYSFNAAGTILNLIIDKKEFNIPLVDLRVSGAGSAPANVAAAYTALSSVFPNANGGSGSTAFASITGAYTDNASLVQGFSTKQATLVSGTNIKTINSTSLLGSGDISISGSGTVATASDLNTGTDNAKFASSLALEGSKYLTQSGSKISATASGTDTYTATIAPAITAYSSGQRFFITFTNANTGAATLNLNSLGAKSLVKNVSTALAAGDIVAGMVMLVCYDGTNLQIISNIQPVVLSPTDFAGLGTAASNITVNSGGIINAATAKTTPVDADYVGLMDSAASNVLKKLSWANIKATAKTYFDTLYAVLASPTFTGTPAAPTAAAATNTTQIATTAHVFAERANTFTFTNKRITSRVGTTTSSATPTINTDNVDFYHLTAQAADITSFTTNLTGTPANDDVLHIAITGTAARAITWGASFEASTIALPTTTVTTNRLDVVFSWNAVTSKWRCGGSW